MRHPAWLACASAVVFDEHGSGTLRTSLLGLNPAVEKAVDRCGLAG